MSFSALLRLLSRGFRTAGPARRERRRKSAAARRIRLPLEVLEDRTLPSTLTVTDLADLATDPHSPGPFRCNGPLSNLPEFAQAFGAKDGDPMVRSAAERARIW